MLNQGHVKFHYGGRKFIIFATLAQLQLIFLIFRLAFHQFRKLNYHFNLSNNRFRKLEMPQKRREILAFFEKIIIETLLPDLFFFVIWTVCFSIWKVFNLQIVGSRSPAWVDFGGSDFYSATKTFLPSKFFSQRVEYTIILRILFLITELKT